MSLASDERPGSWALTTKADHNSIRQGPIPADAPRATAPGERRYPTAWAYFASRGSGVRVPLAPPAKNDPGQIVKSAVDHHDLCQHGHAASCLLPGAGADVGPAWVESPSAAPVTGHAIGGQASDQASAVGRPGPTNRGQVKRKARPRRSNPQRVTEPADTDPGGSPPRTAGNGSHKSVGSGFEPLAPHS